MLHYSLAADLDTVGAVAAQSSVQKEDTREERSDAVHGWAEVVAVAHGQADNDIAEDTVVVVAEVQSTNYDVEGIREVEDKARRSLREAAEVRIW